LAPWLGSLRLSLVLFISSLPTHINYTSAHHPNILVPISAVRCHSRNIERRAIVITNHRDNEARKCLELLSCGFHRSNLTTVAQKDMSTSPLRSTSQNSGLVTLKHPRCTGDRPRRAGEFPSIVARSCLVARGMEILAPQTTPRAQTAHVWCRPPPVSSCVLAGSARQDA